MSYNKDFLKLVEMVYGEGFLPQGHTYALEQMFKNVDLEDKDILDVGSGLGGIDFQLAEKFNARVVGVNPLAIAVEQANQAAQKKRGSFKGAVEFKLLDSDNPTSLTMFADRSFDIIFSRESLLHVPVKKKLEHLKEMFRVLRPGGHIVIVDWTHQTPNYSDELNEMIAMDDVPFNMITPEECLQNLKQAGFKDVQVADDTEKYVQLSQENCNTIKSKKDAIVEKFDLETY